MRYPKYAKIYFENEEWCARLKEDEYVVDGIVFVIKGKKEIIKLSECESYPLNELEESGLKYKKITKKEYKQSIIQITQEQIKKEIDSLYEKIEKLKKEREFILRNF